MTVSVDDAETGGTLTDGVWQPRWDTRELVHLQTLLFSFEGLAVREGGKDGFGPWFPGD